MLVQVGRFVGYRIRPLGTASILNPLYELLKDKCEKSFRKIKELICSNLVLAHYNPELPIVLTCDASNYGLGAVISHITPDGADLPIAFASRTLMFAENTTESTSQGHKNGRFFRNRHKNLNPEMVKKIK
jgi:RNase H-like domain found in reverse transcriptase